MLNLFRWSDDAQEITMEGNSYYFCYKMCVAFREKGNPIVNVRGLHPMHMHIPIQTLIEALGHSSELKYMVEKEFDDLLNSAYSRSLIQGVRRVGLDRFFKCKDDTPFTQIINKSITGD